MTLAEYFKANRHQPKYFLGDRVTGKIGKARWVGCVGNDTLISEEEGPIIHILLDLPIKLDGKWHNILKVKHKDVVPLKVM